MSLVFFGKNILITGASAGIGRAVALELAHKGANLFLVARNKERLVAVQKEVREKYQVKCEFAVADVSNPKQVQAAVQTMLAKMGSIDGLINNAGTSHPGYFEKTPLESFQNLMNVNYMGGVYFTHAVYPHLQSGSFVVFVSSVVGFMGIFGFSSYAGPKFALMGLAETLDQEFSSKGIQVSVLCPPDTETPGFHEEEKTKPYETRKLSENAKLMSAEEVARRFVSKLAKGKFVITVNLESTLFYRLSGMMPGVVRKVMHSIILKAQKEASARKAEQAGEKAKPAPAKAAAAKKTPVAKAPQKTAAVKKTAEKKTAVKKTEKPAKAGSPKGKKSGK